MGKTYTYDLLHLGVYVGSDYSTMSFYINGNGIEPITVSGLYVTQGAVSIPLTCLGKTTFVVPPGGRQCDSFDATSLTLPGIIYVPVLTMSQEGEYDYGVEDPTPTEVPVPGYQFPGFESLFPNLTTDYNKVFDCEYLGTVNDSVSAITPSVNLQTTLDSGYLVMTPKTLGIGTSFTWTLSDNAGLYAALTASGAENYTTYAFKLVNPSTLPGSTEDIFPFHHDSTHGGNNLIKVESTATATMDNLVAYITNHLGGMDNDAFSAVRTDLILTLTLKEEWCIYENGEYGTLSANAQPSIIDYSDDITLTTPPYAFSYSDFIGDKSEFEHIMYVISYPKLFDQVLVDWYNAEVAAGTEASYIETILAVYAPYTGHNYFGLIYTYYSYRNNLSAVQRVSMPYPIPITDLATALLASNALATNLAALECDIGGDVIYRDYMRLYSGKEVTAELEPVVPWVGPKEATITTSEASFTLAVNPTIGDTVTLNLGGEATVLTFTAYTPGTYNIIIGTDLSKTIDNIVAVINALPGAIYLAESSSYTITVTAYSDLAFHITTSITTATVTPTDITISYLATAHGTLPMMYSTAGIVTPGEMPLLSVSATATPGIGGNAVLPLFASSAFAYPSGTGSSASDDADKVALLMTDNDYIESLVAYLFDLTGTDDEIALQVARWVASDITYTADVTDTWNNAATTLVNGYGDCEDGAILQASLMLNAGVDTSRVRVYIGTYMSGVTTGGHAWLEYRRQSDNQWVELDWTKGSAYWNAVASISSVAKTYPDEVQIYIDGSEYITYANVVSLDGDDYINSLIYNENSMTLPLFTVVATDRNRASGAVTMPEMTASGKTGNFGNLTKSLPALTASGFVGSVTASLDGALPLFTIAATGTNANRVTLSSSIPAIRMSGEAYQLNYGIASASLPKPVCSASGYPVIKMVAALELPMLKMAGAGRTSRDFDDFVVKHEYDSWAYANADLPLLTISAGGS
jgi:predicted transglutaminase-like cysteine proteinase